MSVALFGTGPEATELRMKRFRDALRGVRECSAEQQIRRGIAVLDMQGDDYTGPDEGLVNLGPVAGTDLLVCLLDGLTVEQLAKGMVRALEDENGRVDPLENPVAFWFGLHWDNVYREWNEVDEYKQGKGQDNALPDTFLIREQLRRQHKAERVRRNRALRAIEDKLTYASERRAQLSVRGPFDPFAASQRRFLIPGVLVAGEPCVIAGPAKAGKTIVAGELSVSVATARPFLGVYDVPKTLRVSMFSGESGRDTLSETLRGLPGMKPGLEGLRVYDYLPRPEKIAEIVERDRCDVLILDPLYKMPGFDKAQQGDLASRGRYLDDLTEAAKPATLILCCHTRKGIAKLGDVLTLAHLTGSGMEEHPRQWIFMNRRVAFDPMNPGFHDLNVNGGGSARHNFCHRVIITEKGSPVEIGFDVSEYEPVRRGGHDAAEQKETLSGDEKRARKMLACLIDQGGDYSSAKAASKMNGTNAKKALACLLNDPPRIEPIPGVEDRYRILA